MADKMDTLEDEVRIAMVGKYTGLSDSYLSVIKALQHSAFAVGRKLQIDWIESTDLDPNDRTDNHEEAWEDAGVSGRNLGTWRIWESWC